MMERADPIQWAKVIDHTRCIGCHACTTACKSENLVPLSVTRRHRNLSASAPGSSGDALQPVRARALRNCVPDCGDVQTR
jgi:Fe-S-cluster-containing dehydrogenase component